MRRIEIRSLHKRFGEIIALAGFDLRVGAGESIVILGPSGSGKSTLLRVIAGIEDPDKGDVLFDGESQLLIPPHRRGVAMVFQNFALYPHLSARKNILLGLRHGLRLNKEEAEARVAEVAHTLDITELLDRRPGKMSGGQRQRVALGRALARRAEIILLDEPWSGLDAQLRQELRLEIRTLLHSLGTTAIFVTHDQLDAMAIGDRIAVMDAGKLVQVGTPEEIYEHPASTFVARFVGVPPMNLLPGVVKDGQLQSPAETPLSLEVEDGEVWVGIRPERLRPEGEGEFCLRGELIAEELSAGEWIVHLSTGEHVVAMRAEFPERPRIGRRMLIAASTGDIRLFERESGESLKFDQ
jgi:multiple sugar transport system ATP-binding protein